MGTLLAISGALGYSAANLALRKLTQSSSGEGPGWDIVVAAMKAMPTAVVAWALIGRKLRAGKPAIPPLKMVFPLLIAALVMQFGGNVGFQIAMGNIGLAITVPLVFSCIIVTGAVLGRTMLGDAVSGRSVISIALMMIAILMLSGAARNNAADVAGHHVFGVFMALVSGCSYGVNGVVIRKFVRQTLGVESTLVVYSTTGVVFLGSIGVSSMGFDQMLQIRGSDWILMVVAGTFNCIAFFSISHAFKSLTVTRVNVINASQNAMCAFGAVLIFNERVTPWMAGGIAVTIAGLLVLDRERQ